MEQSEPIRVRSGPSAPATLRGVTDVTPFFAPVGEDGVAEIGRRPGRGVDLAVAEAGAGGRPLMVVHGFTGSKEEFSPVAGHLARAGIHVAVPDLRGHGDSEWPGREGSYSLATFAADILALADDLGWDRFDLLGHSMGGLIAQDILRHHPERVGRLILMGTLHRSPRFVLPRSVVLSGVIPLVRRRGMEPLARLAPYLDRLGAPPPVRRLLDAEPGRLQWSADSLRRVDPAMWCSLVREFAHLPDRLGWLARWPGPATVIVGDHDSLSLDHSHNLAATLPAADLRVIPDAGHCPQYESPTRWLECLLDVLGHGPVPEAG